MRVSSSSRSKNILAADERRSKQALLLSAFIGGSLFFAPPTRDSVLTGARPGRSEQVSQSDSSAASTHWVDLGRSESPPGTQECRHECLRHENGLITNSTTSGVRRLISALLCFCRQDYPLLMRCLVSPLFTASKRSR